MGLIQVALIGRGGSAHEGDDSASGARPADSARAAQGGAAVDSDEGRSADGTSHVELAGKDRGVAGECVGGAGDGEGAGAVLVEAAAGVGQHGGGAKGGTRSAAARQ